MPRPYRPRRPLGRNPARPPQPSRRGKAPPSPKPGQPTHWDSVTDWYDRLVGERGSEYHQRVVLPGVFRLLDVDDRPRPFRVLDVACGQGVLCRALAERGAEVVGVDAAPGLIDAARQRNEAERLAVEYHVADASKLEEHAELHGRFDAVTCILAIQNIAVLSPVWRGCRAALKPGGRLVVVMMHPCFRVPKASDWAWEDRPDAPGGGVQSRRVDRYLSSAKVPIQMHPGSDPSLTTTTFHRPLQAYVNTMAESGLLIDHLDEWPSHKKSDRTDPKAPAQNLARREIPMFLALRAVAV